MNKNVVTLARGQYAGMRAEVRAVLADKNLLEVKVLGGHGVHKVNVTDLLWAGEELTDQARRNAEALRLRKQLHKAAQRRKKSGNRRSNSVWAIPGGLPGLGRRR